MKHISHWEDQASLELTSEQNIPGEDQICAHKLKGEQEKKTSASNISEFCF